MLLKLHFHFRVFCFLGTNLYDCGSNKLNQIWYYIDCYQKNPNTLISSVIQFVLQSCQCFHSPSWTIVLHSFGVVIIKVSH